VNVAAKRKAVDEASDLIRKITTLGDIKELNEVLRQQWKKILRAAANQVEIGTKVVFTTRRGEEIRGTVQAVNRTTVAVIAHDTKTRWRVAATLLRHDDSAS